MKNKRVKHFDKKIILISAVVLVVLAIQIESLSKYQVRKQFRCALRRIRGGNSANLTTASNIASTTAQATVPAPATAPVTAPVTVPIPIPTVPIVTTAAAPGTTIRPAKGPIRVSQSCNTGDIGTEDNAERTKRIKSNIH